MRFGLKHFWLISTHRLFSNYIERKGRYIAKGPMGLEVGMAREMPILDVRKLNDKQLSSLAELFDELEREARRSVEDH